MALAKNSSRGENIFINTIEPTLDCFAYLEILPPYLLIDTTHVKVNCHLLNCSFNRTSSLQLFYEGSTKTFSEVIETHKKLQKHLFSNERPE